MLLLALLTVGLRRVYSVSHKFRMKLTRTEPKEPSLTKELKNNCYPRHQDLFFYSHPRLAKNLNFRIIKLKFLAWTALKNLIYFKIKYIKFLKEENNYIHTLFFFTLYSFNQLNLKKYIIKKINQILKGGR